MLGFKKEDFINLKQYVGTDSRDSGKNMRYGRKKLNIKIFLKIFLKPSE
jgi:hypothetical protein